MYKNDANKSTACIVCGSNNTQHILDTVQVPAYCNVLWPTYEKAINAPKGEIRLVFCSDCGHIFNSAFDRSAVTYTETYENSLDFSPRFQSYAESLTLELIERFDLRQKEIIEIGSGNGNFLRLLCEIGDNQGTGFDPSYAPDRSQEEEACRVNFIQDIYSEKYAQYCADFVCCRHTLEHVADPLEFVRMLRRMVESQRDTAIFFEVPNVMYTLRDLGIWDLIYEHCSYFSTCSLARLFMEGGFRVRNTTVNYGDQFLCIDAFVQSNRDEDQHPLCDEQAELHSCAENFAIRYGDKIAEAQRQLQMIGEAGRHAVLWGAGSKGVTFLNALQDRGEIECVVDINPRKQGMYVSGTGHQIVEPESLRQCRPDVVIIMNSIYRQEILRTLDDLNVKAEIILA